MLVRFYSGSKVNYVDDHNRFAGFDMGQQCCEVAHHGVYDLKGRKLEFICKDNSWPDLFFADKEPIFDKGEVMRDLVGTDLFRYVDEGGMVRFELVDRHRRPAGWLVFFNGHNGWYTHGGEYNLKPGTAFGL